MTKAPLKTSLEEARVTLPGGFANLTDADIEEICEAFDGLPKALADGRKPSPLPPMGTESGGRSE